MKFLKILILSSLNAGIVSFASAMESSANKEIVTETTVTSPLDVVTNISDIQAIIIAFIYEWKICKTIINNNDEIMLSSVTPDGKKIFAIVVNFDNFLSGPIFKCKVWDIETGNEFQITILVEDIKLVTISPDSKKIIYGSGCNIMTWDLETDKNEKTFTNSTIAKCIAVTSDNSCLIIGTEDGTIKICDLNSGELLKTLNGNTDHVYSVVCSQDGKKIISSSKDKTIRVWDFKTGDQLLRITDTNPSETCYITADEKYIISVHTAQINLWDLNTGSLLETLKEDPNDTAKTILEKLIKFYSNKKDELMISLYIKSSGKWDYNSTDWQSIEKEIIKWVHPSRPLSGKFHDLISVSGVISLNSYAKIHIWKNIIFKFNNRLIQKAFTILAKSAESSKETQANSPQVIQNNSAEIPSKSQEKKSIGFFKNCSNLNCTKEATKQCARCKIAYYCSTACQCADWNKHRLICKKRNNEATYENF